jgi:hypothetical protein
MRPHLGIHFPGALEDDRINSLPAQAFPSNCGTLRDLSEQAPRQDAPGSAPLIYRLLGPDGNRDGSNATVLTCQISYDPSIFYDAELPHQNRCSLTAPKAAAEQYRQDGAVPFALHRARIWSAKKFAGACGSQPLANADTVQSKAMDLGDRTGDAAIEETVIGHFLGKPPHCSQPQINRGRGQFLLD